jgi:peptidoglycan/LPS O-acetylase OafA/YrhL
MVKARTFSFSTLFSREWLTTGRRLSCQLDERESNNFNLIRLAAAILVILSHCYGFGHKDPLQRLTNNLIRGSDIAMPAFFFLSGLLVTQSLDHSPSGINFLWRRFLRIYPAALLFVLLTALVMGPLVTTLPLQAYFSDPLFRQYWQISLLFSVYHNLPGVFSNSTRLGSLINVSLSSLPVEIKLYFLLFLLGLFRNKRLLLVASLAGVTFLALGIVFYTPFNTLLKSWLGPSFVLQPYTSFAIYFFTGVLAYHYRQKIVVYHYWGPLLPVAWLAATQLPYPDIASLILLPASVLFVGLNATRLLSRITPRPDLSYGFYIWGFPLQQVIVNILGLKNDGLTFLLDLLFVLPLALLSWYAVESPSLRLKNRLK